MCDSVNVQSRFPVSLKVNDVPDTPSSTRGMDKLSPAKRSTDELSHSHMEDRALPVCDFGDAGVRGACWMQAERAPAFRRDWRCADRQRRWPGADGIHLWNRAQRRAG